MPGAQGAHVAALKYVPAGQAGAAKAGAPVALCVAVPDAVRISDEEAVAEEDGGKAAEASAVWVALAVADGENAEHEAVPLTKVPGGHVGAQREAPAGLYVPAGQAAHEAAPVPA